jgi:nucleoside-diphosphate-sugar epimerase
MRVLLTGATGFVGRYLAVDLARRGHRVRIAVRVEPDPGAVPSGTETAMIGDLAGPVDWRPRWPASMRSSTRPASPTPVPGFPTRCMIV